MDLSSRQMRSIRKFPEKRRETTQNLKHCVELVVTGTETGCIRSTTQTGLWGCPSRVPKCCLGATLKGGGYSQGYWMSSGSKTFLRFEFHERDNHMLANTRGRWARVSSSLILALVLVLMLSTMASAGGPIVHRASVGGPDACVGFGLPPGCDANFSLVAMERADGTVSGQYIDRFPQGEGVHATINCLRCRGQRGVDQWCDYWWQNCRVRPDWQGLFLRS